MVHLFSHTLHYLRGFARFQSSMRKKYDKKSEETDSKEGGRCHRVELTIVEHDRAKKEDCWHAEGLMAVG